MNWLAHLFLSEPTPAFRVGNLLPDLLSNAEVSALGGEFQRGARCHLAIDCFTDAHPVFRRSAGRVSRDYRRLGGILTDMFYDHILSREWGHYSPLVPLDRFVSDVHFSFETCRPALSPAANERLRQIAEGGLLSSYQHIRGIHHALVRIGRRFRRPVDMGPAIAELERHYKEFSLDFAEFFPELRAHVDARSA